ncbi:hypothetical protein F4560_001052 [Saccharothrix ecbatanensis]|uniref:Uncharacterized protein n=1 Tax=Saccharothrix ecbatanensis TaxID=1105145 RepID=A0A7W9LYW5_9PSEU|nr:hypothetical protein [Saccharothrix ecbatanensis]
MTGIGTKLRHTLVLVTTTISTLLTPHPAEAQHAPFSVGCGFRHVNPDHHEGATGLYTHCADSFILIRVDTADGSYHTCVSPWGSRRFFPSGRVNNAYYVPIRPRLLTASDGRQICSVTQPPA